MNRILSLILASVFVAAAFSGCQAGNTPAKDKPSNSMTNTGTESEPLKIVTTIFPPYDFVREIAGEHVELSMLLSPGSESHSYDPTPQDIITIQSCDVFLYVGGDTDVWVDRILESMDTSSITLLPLIDMVEAVEEEIVEGMEENHDHADDHGHDDEEDHDHADEHRELDEHVWTAPANAIRIVERIAQVLTEKDPDNATVYKENSAAYCASLEELHRQYQSMVDGAARTTVIFGDRFPFRYLADAYGLTYYAAFPGCSTETEASAATVAFLIDKVTAESIPVVFHIELSNEKMADAICESTGAQKRLLHSCHNVTRDDFLEGVTYLQLMERNLEHLKEALYE